MKKTKHGYISTYCEHYRGWNIYATFEPKIEIENETLSIEKQEIEIPIWVLEERKKDGMADYHIEWIKERIDKTLASPSFIYIPKILKSELKLNEIFINLNEVQFVHIVDHRKKEDTSDIDILIGFKDRDYKIHLSAEKANSFLEQLENFIKGIK